MKTRLPIGNLLGFAACALLLTTMVSTGLGEDAKKKKPPKVRVKKGKNSPQARPTHPKKCKPYSPLMPLSWKWAMVSFPLWTKNKAATYFRAFAPYVGNLP